MITTMALKNLTNEYITYTVIVSQATQKTKTISHKTNFGLNKVKIFGTIPLENKGVYSFYVYDNNIYLSVPRTNKFNFCYALF